MDGLIFSGKWIRTLNGPGNEVLNHFGACPPRHLSHRGWASGSPGGFSISAGAGAHPGMQRRVTIRRMKLHVLSDLHLEFDARHPPWAPPATGADVVILAGDIHNGTGGIDWAEQAFAGTPVIYVPGNHEFYGMRHGPALTRLKARAVQSPNVRVLDEDELLIDGVRFLGATLWTDFALFGESLMEPAS
jgi:hypothetical protein